MTRMLALTASTFLFSSTAFGIANAGPSPGFQGSWTCKTTRAGTVTIAIQGNTVTTKGPGGYRIRGPLEGSGNTASVQYTTNRWSDRFQLTPDGKLNVSGNHDARNCTK